ncbi:integrase catalytic domain-containing protein [Trichonephila clavipes]|nr:integrase catalytic domain-containing protein [Trichonephila clavipes]
MIRKNICLGISRINDSRVLQKLATHNIFISDSSANNKLCLFEKHSDEIHILLGSDIIGKLFTGEVKQLSEWLTAVNTRLGWTVMGKLSCESKFELENSLLVHSLFTNREKISDLWELDSLGIKDPSEKKSKLELQDLALKHFENTVLRDDEGRYIVSIPWIEENEKLKDHYSLAKRRLEKTVKTLKFTGRLIDYEQVFVDWEKEGIIEKIAQDEPKIGGKFHYLPHRPVFKENSKTKICPVFDGSAHHRKSCSLNDCVEKRPNLIGMIPAILNRFRLGKIGVRYDIRKAFVQISLHENDMNVLPFLWWEGGNSEKTAIYRHRRVDFEVSCSPFLLAAVLNHHFKQAPEHLEKAAEKLKDSMYVDNCVASVDSSEELESFQRDSTELLALGKFDLRGCRHSDIESNFDFQDNQQKYDPQEIQVLGLMWNVKDDTLFISYRETELKEEVTKRRILSLAHRIFDPIGFTCPFTLIPKLLIEECWKMETSWNSKLQIYIERKFESDSKRNLYRYKKDLPQNRVRDAAIFEIIGLDLAGLLILKNGEKNWILILTCAVYRAIHLELLTSVSTESFLLGLRFIARRGRPSIIYSDNGTNFKGAYRLYQKVNLEKLKNVEELNPISWKFIPPQAPWSLTYVTDDVEDLEPLTPAMFLQDIREIGVPELDQIDENKLNKILVYRNRIQNDLRKRFRVEYLGQLRETRNIKGENTLSEGDIVCVLVGVDHTKRLNWNLGKILELYPSKDKKVGVAQVKTKFGSFLRPVRKLYFLEVMEKNKSSVHPTNSPLFSDANEVSHIYIPINIDPELSQPQGAATSSMQPCSSISNGGVGLEPRVETRGHQQAETSSMQTCSSVSDVEAGVEPRLETLENCQMS